MIEWPAVNQQPDIPSLYDSSTAGDLSQNVLERYRPNSMVFLRYITGCFFSIQSNDMR